MAEKQEAVVGVIKTNVMQKYLLLFFVVFFSNAILAQDKPQDSVFKKPVLEKAEIDFLMSYYTQDGQHSSVGGGIGTEALEDITPTIVVSIPLNVDDVLTIDAGISAYSSASSSNLNPFDASGASSGDDDDDDDDGGGAIMPYGSPWISSTGASKSDVLTALSIAYSHNSDDRNTIWDSHVAYSVEYDYSSIGFGGGFTKLYNQQNTMFGLKANVYLDKWKTLYPTELEEFAHYGADFLTEGFFDGVTVYNQDGNPSLGYNPIQFEVIKGSDKNRNTFTTSFSFSQILTKKLQISLFFDVIYQQGLLSTPYHRIYFSDSPNYYIGENVVSSISNYETPENTSVFHLADAIEKLPNTRLKLPIGARLNYFINEYIALRSYYRLYTDNWGVTAHTASIELPVKITRAITFFPTYRYYTQTAVTYFSPYNTHLSTDNYYTSDYDLSRFNSTQLGLGFRYTDIFTKLKVYNVGLKNIELKYSYYNRNDGLDAHIVSGAVKFIIN